MPSGSRSRTRAGRRTASRSSSAPLALEPSNAQAHQNAGIALLRLERLPTRRGSSLETALSIEPPQPASLNALGVVYSRLGEPRKALEAWSRCVEVDPQQFDALYNLGRVAGDLGDWTRRGGRSSASRPPRRRRAIGRTSWK